MKRDTSLLLKSLSFFIELPLNRDRLCWFSPRAISALGFGAGFLLVWIWILRFCFVLTLEKDLCISLRIACVKVLYLSLLWVFPGSCHVYFMCNTVSPTLPTFLSWALTKQRALASGTFLPRWAQPLLHCPAFQNPSGRSLAGPWHWHCGNPWVTPQLPRVIACCFSFSNCSWHPKIRGAIETAPLVQLLISCPIVWTSLGFNFVSLNRCRRLLLWSLSPLIRMKCGCCQRVSACFAVGDLHSSLCYLGSGRIISVSKQ